MTAEPPPVPQLPLGTQVVLRRATGDEDGGTVQRGATGAITDLLADGRYRVRLPDGRQVVCGRAELNLRRAHQAAIALGDVQSDLAEGLVRDHTIFCAVVGSRAFGLATSSSDTDLRGVFAAPTALFWSLSKPPAHVDGPAPEQVSWEVERFCELALKANPNALEVLWSPLVVVRTQVGSELAGLRDAFLSQLVYQTFSGYVLSQFKRLEADLRQHGAPRWKHAMHLLRLLLSAGALLRSGELQVDVSAHRDRLLAVRRGEVPWAEVEAWRLSLHASLDDALAVTPLPASPDAGRVDGWLHSVRERSVAGPLP